MFRKLFLAAAIVLATVTAKADEGRKIASKVQKVILFLKGAQVTRSATVTVPTGNTELMFTGLSPNIDPQSIQVHAAGEFTILSVKNEMNYLDPEIKNIQVEQLIAKQNDLRNKITIQNNLLSVYQAEEQMIAKNQQVKADNTTLNPLQLKQALDFQTERLTSLKQKEMAVNLQITDLNNEIEKYNAQIYEINKAKTKPVASSNILIRVSAKAALQSTFTLNYVVRDAEWYPSYDIRAKNISSPVTIAYKANVSQQSGEDWNNVKLILSTGNPTVSGNKPELSPYYLTEGMYYINASVNQGGIKGHIFDNNDRQSLPGVSIRVKGSTIGTVTDSKGNFSLQLPPGNNILEISYVGYETQEIMANTSFLNVPLRQSSNALNEVVVTGYGYESQAKRDLQGAVAGINVQTVPVGVTQVENQTNVEFNITDPYTIPTDGKQYVVEINDVDVKASYQYYVAPKLNTDVFLTAQLTDWNKYNFLSGEANLYFEDTYIGKSLIDTHNTADTLNISLGTDKDILVTRSLQKNMAEKQFLGLNKKETKNWLITVKNRKSQKVNLLVEDQVPVSQNSSIEVEVQESGSVKPDPLTGKVSWNFLLNSQEEKKTQLRYTVKYPKNQLVIVQ